MMDEFPSKSLVRAFYNQSKEGGYSKYSTSFEQERRLAAIVAVGNLDSPLISRVLDVGCGVGWLTMQYATVARNAMVIGTDFAEEAVAEAAANSSALNNAEFAVMDAEELSFRSHSFDIVICSEVLEHLLHPESAVRQIARVVHRDGCVVITTPNPWSLQLVSFRLRQALARYIFGKELKRRQIVDRPISPLRLNRMLEAAGLEVIERRGVYYMPLAFGNIFFLNRSSAK